MQSTSMKLILTGLHNPLVKLVGYTFYSADFPDPRFGHQILTTGLFFFLLEFIWIESWVSLHATAFHLWFYKWFSIKLAYSLQRKMPMNWNAIRLNVIKRQNIWTFTYMINYTVFMWTLTVMPFQEIKMLNKNCCNFLFFYSLYVAICDVWWLKPTTHWIERISLWTFFFLIQFVILFNCMD